MRTTSRPDHRPSGPARPSGPYKGMAPDDPLVMTAGLEALCRVNLKGDRWQRVALPGRPSDTERFAAAVAIEAGQSERQHKFWILVLKALVEAGWAHRQGPRVVPGPDQRRLRPEPEPVGVPGRLLEQRRLLYALLGGLDPFPPRLAEQALCVWVYAPGGHYGRAGLTLPAEQKTACLVDAAEVALLVVRTPAGAGPYAALFPLAEDATFGPPRTYSLAVEPTHRPVGDPPPAYGPFDPLESGEFGLAAVAVTAARWLAVLALPAAAGLAPRREAAPVAAYATLRVADTDAARARATALAEAVSVVYDPADDVLDVPQALLVGPSAPALDPELFAAVGSKLLWQPGDPWGATAAPRYSPKAGASAAVVPGMLGWWRAEDARDEKFLVDVPGLGAVDAGLALPPELRRPEVMHVA